MKLPVRSALLLLPLLLTGCSILPFHRTHSTQARTLAPHLHPPQSIPLTEVQLPPEDTVIAANTIYNMWIEAQPIVPPVKRRRLPNPADAATAPDLTPSPAVNAIGQLSSGDGADFRQQTENSIADIERRINGIHRTLSDPEMRTVDHIREFLKQARAALASGDVEGARTLATKAEVLLEELPQ